MTTLKRSSSWSWAQRNCRARWTHLDASAINTNYALSAGLSPAKDAIAPESAKSPHANLLAVREQDKAQPWVAKLVKAYQSEETRNYVLTEFKGAVVIGF